MPRNDSTSSCAIGINNSTPSQIDPPAPCASQKAKAPCRLCYRLIGEKSKAILCDYCDNWCHQSCTGLDDVTFEALAKSNQKFFCSLCMPTVNHFLALDKRIDSVEHRMANFEDRLAKLEAAEPRPPPLMGLPFFGGAPARPKPDDEYRVKLRDELERESKRKNAVLFGLEATEANDTETIKELIAKANLKDLTPNDVVTVFRDGPTYEDKPRFCKVYLKNVDAKNSFVSFINTSRKNNVAGFSSMRSRPDLSYLQRKIARELREELNSRSENGETNLYVDYKAECVKRRRVI